MFEYKLLMAVGGTQHCNALMNVNGVIVFFFFFKQKTAYEIRPRDWSSDVCSSDLLISSASTTSKRTCPLVACRSCTPGRSARLVTGPVRSEERRVGKECRSRWS